MMPFSAPVLAAFRAGRRSVEKAHLSGRAALPGAGNAIR